jgi:hypothetical protein
MRSWDGGSMAKIVIIMTFEQCDMPPLAPLAILCSIPGTPIVQVTSASYPDLSNIFSVSKSL